MRRTVTLITLSLILDLLIASTNLTNLSRPRQS
nr:MAG TPA: hypothetical protein [Caudoviricetes sp.]